MSMLISHEILKYLGKFVQKLLKNAYKCSRNSRPRQSFFAEIGAYWLNAPNWRAHAHCLIMLMVEDDWVRWDLVLSHTFSFP